MESCIATGRRRRIIFVVASILTFTLLDSVAPFAPTYALFLDTSRQRLVLDDPTNQRRRNAVGHQQQVILFSSTAESSSSSSAAASSTVSLPETVPLPPHTFAGQVEQALIEKFGRGGGDTSSIDRVLQSWRLLERDYVHRQYVGPDESSSTTSQCHQLAHSYVPGLTAREFWDPSQFDWCQKLQSKYSAIRQEFLRVTANAEALATQGNNIWAGALTNDAASYGPGWQTLVLMNRGFWDAVNVNLFPVTAQAVHQSQCPAVEVFFASMQPHTNIAPHSDFTNFVMTSHLPLVVPGHEKHQCRLKIGDTERPWVPGELLLFDTSIMHEAVNESDDVRYILMLRVWHPDLTATEREALQFIYSVLEFPALLDQRETTQREVDSMRRFPVLHKGTGRKSGFGGMTVVEAGKQKNKKKKGNK